MKLESPYSAQNPRNYIARWVDCKAKRTLASKMPAFAEAGPGGDRAAEENLIDEDREQD